jgi:hypothetical protein
MEALPALREKPLISKPRVRCHSNPPSRVDQPTRHFLMNSPSEVSRPLGSTGLRCHPLGLGVTGPPRVTSSMQQRCRLPATWRKLTTQCQPEHRG